MSPVEFQRVPVREQLPQERIRNFQEVSLGYNEEEAVAEAKRCLNCKNAPCRMGCPVNIDIPKFIKHIAEREFMEAALELKRWNNLPAICGRVCPQERQCEQPCVVGRRGDPINIGKLERFAADWELEHGVEIPRLPEPIRHKVAIVGAGPSGLTVAGNLAYAGITVTLFEALHKEGGVLVYGIPEFRLPKKIVAAEADYIKRLGVEINLNVLVGRTVTIDDLFAEDYEAVFLGTGAGLPLLLNIPGENLNGVLSANEYLIRSNLMKAYKFPEYDTPTRRGKKVAVIGAGDVSMDCARTALRLGADKSMIIYRRSFEEMPARREEYHHAEEEGVEFNWLTAPVRVLEDKGSVAGLECIRMQLGEPDASGRRKPAPIEGSNFEIEADTVVIAIGTTPNPLIAMTTPGLEMSAHGTVVVDKKTGKTTRVGVFAGGDVISGGATVISAMGEGKIAVESILKYLEAKW